MGMGLGLEGATRGSLFFFTPSPPVYLGIQFVLTSNLAPDLYVDPRPLHSRGALQHSNNLDDRHALVAC